VFEENKKHSSELLLSRSVGGALFIVFAVAATVMSGACCWRHIAPPARPSVRPSVDGDGTTTAVDNIMCVCVVDDDEYRRRGNSDWRRFPRRRSSTRRRFSRSSAPSLSHTVGPIKITITNGRPAAWLAPVTSRRRRC